VTEPPAPFAGLLRELRAAAGMRREKLAEAPGLSPQATSDLKRVATPHKARHRAPRSERAYHSYQDESCQLASDLAAPTALMLTSQRYRTPFGILAGSNLYVPVESSFRKSVRGGT
jgi:hypothetical protein